MRLSLRRPSDKEETKEIQQDTEYNPSENLSSTSTIPTIKITTADSDDKLNGSVTSLREIKKEIPARPSELAEKEAEPPPSSIISSPLNPSIEQFKRMRPTSWSPPPGKLKHTARERVSDPGPFNHIIVMPENKPNHSIQTSWSPIGSPCSKIEISSKPEINICKITVSPKSTGTPLVHRLQVGGEFPKGSRRTSILINGDQSPEPEPSVTDNKVTISVGGEDSVCNPTVISVNSTSPPKIQSSMENRTLVILDNYQSNIVLESAKDKAKDDNKMADKKNEKKMEDNQECSLREEKTRWSALSKESLISKLLEDSLRKARENGEILDESSGEAILRILKQSLLKTKEYESSESTLEAEQTFSRSPSLHSDVDFSVTTNLFLEENPYEVIKEPIYEEIPDEPPPLPLSPPPTEDYIKGRIYFPEEYKESYYKKVNAGQYLGSYLTDDVFKKSEDGDYLSKSPQEFFNKPASTADGKLTKKFELLNFLMDKERPVVEVEEDEVEDDDEDTEGDLEALYEQKETSMGDLSSKSSQISNVSDSSEECNIILTSSTEASKVIFFFHKNLSYLRVRNEISFRLSTYINIFK